MAGIEAGSSQPIAQSIIAHSENEKVKAVHFDSIDVYLVKSKDKQMVNIMN